MLDDQNPDPDPLSSGRALIYVWLFVENSIGKPHRGNDRLLPTMVFPQCGLVSPASRLRMECLGSLFMLEDPTLLDCEPM